MGLKLVIDTKDAVRAADEFAKAVEKVRKAVGETGKAADKFQSVTDKMARRFGSIGKAAEKAGGSVEKFNTAISKVPAQADRASTSVQRLGRASSTSGGQIQSLVRQFLGFQAARKAVSTIADLESGLVTLGTVTGKTGAELNELKETAVSVARETRFTPEETIGALLSLSRAGQDAAQASESLISVTQLAQAGVTSLGQAADLTAATLAQFQSQGVNAATAASTLVATADRTKSTVLSLGASLAQAGQAAATFGVSLSETAAVAGVLQDSGVQASRAGRAIKTILAQLASAGERSEASRKSLSLLGLEIGEVIPSQSQKFTDVLRNIREGLEGIGGEQRTNILRNLVGKDFFAVLSAAIDGIEKIDRVSAIAADSVAELEGKADRQNETLAASIRGVGSAFQEVLIDADGARKSLKGVFDTFAGAVRILGGAEAGLSDLSDEAFTLAKAIKAISFTALIAGAAKLTAVFATSPIGVAAVAAGTLIVALEDMGKSLLGVSDRLIAARKEFFEFSDNIDRSRQSAFDLSQEIKRLQFTNMDKAKVKMADLAAVAETALDNFSKLGKLSDEELSETLGALTILGDRDVGGLSPELKEQVKSVQGLATEYEIVTDALKDFVALSKESASGILGEGDLALLERARDVLEEAFGSDFLTSKTVSELFGSTERNIKAAEAAQKELAEQISTAVKGLLSQANLEKRLAADAERRKAIEEENAAAVNKQAEQREKALAVLQKELEAERATVNISTIKRQLTSAILDDQEGQEALQSRLVDMLTAQLAISKGVSLQDREAMETLREVARLKADELVRTIEIRKATQDKAKAEKSAREEAKKNLDIQKKLSEEIKRQRGVQSARLGAFQDIRSLQGAVGLARQGKDSDILTNQALFDQQLAESIEALKSQGISQEEAIKLAEQRLNLEKELIRIGKERAEADELSAKLDRIKSDRESAELGRSRALDSANLQLMRAQLELGGDTEGVALLDRQQAAVAAGFSASTPEFDEFMEVQEQLSKVKEQLQAEAQLRSGFNRTLNNFISTLIQSEGDMKEALGSLIQGIAQTFLQDATENLSGSLAKSFGSFFSGGTTVPEQVGGIIPAQVGQIISSPTVVQRGGRNYSISEGGGSTPEAVMPLMRDNKGRLGVAGGGGGMTTINMNFPNVQNTQEARGLRTSMSQTLTSVLGTTPKKSRGARNKK